MSASKSGQKAGKSIVGSSERTKFVFSTPAEHREYYDNDECARVVDTLPSAKKLCDKIEELTRGRHQLRGVIPGLGPFGLAFKVRYSCKSKRHDPWA